MARLLETLCWMLRTNCENVAWLANNGVELHTGAGMRRVYHNSQFNIVEECGTETELSAKIAGHQDDDLEQDEYVTGMCILR
ncbi:hypothetical protein BIW11_09888 [Tropilaelaps mercedesae]|uniref:Uncharacterized protein n=1 Tax=Tropilaelaps mercedesae TaxID=418985 RepID=A0A1V9XIL8_9ACAR|nr:hypothetical protein BIW11_09888 [Tropilaelaps mercedesae]